MKVEIRPIRKEDNAAVKNLIQSVMPEFGASGAGFAIHDAEVHDMYSGYQDDRSVYYVCVVNGQIVGGAGIAPLKGGDTSVCELKKMYFLPSARGRGYGRSTLMVCIEKARELGYKKCYLETFNTMKDAMVLYEKAGFRKISQPLGNTGHFACDTFYELAL